MHAISSASHRSIQAAIGPSLNSSRRRTAMAKAVLAIAAFGVAAIWAQDIDEVPNGLTTENDVNDAKLLSRDVCEMKNALTDPDRFVNNLPDYASARDVFVDGMTLDDANLQELAEMDLSDEDLPSWSLFADYYGSNAFIDDFVRPPLCQGLADEGYCAGHTDGPLESASRNEYVLKTMQNWIPLTMSIADMERAISSLEDGNNDEARMSWDRAYAFYVGADPLTEDCSPYTTTFKRESNYGIPEGRNQDMIMDAFVDGASAIESGNVDELEEAYRLILGMHMVTYAQATTRYANFLDVLGEAQAPAFDQKAEGEIFYNLIAPYVSLVDPEGDDVVRAVFDDPNIDPEAGQGYYCQVEAVMRCFVQSLSEYGVTEEEYGLLENAVEECNVSCDGDQMPVDF